MRFMFKSGQHTGGVAVNTHQRGHLNRALAISARQDLSQPGTPMKAEIAPTHSKQSADVRPARYTLARCPEALR